MYDLTKFIPQRNGLSANIDCASRVPAYGMLVDLDRRFRFAVAVEGEVSCWHLAVTFTTIVTGGQSLNRVYKRQSLICIV